MKFALTLSCLQCEMCSKKRGVGGGSEGGEVATCVSPPPEKVRPAVRRLLSEMSVYQQKDHM